MGFQQLNLVEERQKALPATIGSHMQLGMRRGGREADDPKV